MTPLIDQTTKPTGTTPSPLFSTSYRVLIDGEEKAAGGLDDDGAFEPPLRPPSEVADPDDAQPADWDEREE